MGRKGGKKGEPNLTSALQQRSSMTLREESKGKKQGNLNPKTMCKLDHLKNIAVWAAAEANIPSLGAFFGQRLAATTEALGVRNDPSLFLCQRCESTLQPGQNCIVRIEKNKSKKRQRRKKTNIPTQNNVVYTCQFCSYPNLLRGTSKGYIKQICPSKVKQPLSKSNIAKSVLEEYTKFPEVTTGVVDNVALPVEAGQNLGMSPLPATALSLLDAKKRKRSRSSAKKAEPESSSVTTDAENSNYASSKRRKNSWKSLKEIAQSSELNTGKKIPSITVPFFI